MIVRGFGLGSPRNGLPEPRRWYSYQGTRTAQEEDAPRQPGITARAVAALRALGGEASALEARAVMELDGGGPVDPRHLNVALHRLARKNPPQVTRCGRDGNTVRWRLEPGGEG